MSTKHLPRMDSIRELAAFWDTHDVTDFEDELVDVNDRVFKPKSPLALRDTSLVGRAKELEVAGMLIRNGIFVFWPFVDTGADLLATNRDATRCVPVQVKYAAKTSGLGLTKADEKRFRKPNTIIAFLVGKENAQRAWFLPFNEWQRKAVDRNRRDERVYVQIGKNAKWLSQFEGDGGIRRVFSDLLGASGKNGFGRKSVSADVAPE